MKIQLKVKHLILILAVLGAGIWALLAWSGHKHQRELDRLSVRLYGAQDSIASYQIKVGGLEETVYRAQLSIISKDKYIFGLEEEGDRLRQMKVRDVDAIIRLETEVSILKDSLKPEQGEVVSMAGLGLSTTSAPEKTYLPLPNRFSFTDGDVKLLTEIDSDGSAGLGVVLRDPLLTVTLGSAGVFKKHEVALVTSDNPYVVVDKANVVVVDKQKAPARYFLTGTAIGAGLVLALSFIL